MKYNGSEIISEILNEWRNSVPFSVTFVGRVNFRDGCVEIQRAREARRGDEVRGEHNRCV